VRSIIEMEESFFVEPVRAGDVILRPFQKLARVEVSRADCHFADFRSLTPRSPFVNSPPAQFQDKAHFCDWSGRPSASFFATVALEIDPQRRQFNQTRIRCTCAIQSGGGIRAAGGQLQWYGAKGAANAIEECVQRAGK
jgi:hypothetical protein